MSYEPITRTAPGWEERTVTLLPPGARSTDGVGPPVGLRPGFARLALLLDVTAFGGGSGLRVHVQHSRDGARWHDIAAFAVVTEAGSQIAWLEAQPALAGSVEAATDGGMPAGAVHSGFVLPRLRVRWSLGGETVHAFGVDAVAIYRRGG